MVTQVVAETSCFYVTNFYSEMFFKTFRYYHYL